MAASQHRFAVLSYRGWKVVLESSSVPQLRLEVSFNYKGVYILQLEQRGWWSSSGAWRTSHQQLIETEARMRGGAGARMQD